MSATTSSEPLTLGAAFAAARAAGRAALVPYVTAGHPTPADTPAVLAMLAEEGADVIELGVPFSDPLADGPTIQKSSFEAIAQGADLPWVLRVLADFRREFDTPVVLFTYLNPILRYGVDRFLADAAAAGAQGVLVTDLPVGADPALEGLFHASPLDLVRLVAPTTKPARVREIARAARGFLYYVSRTGVTGARQELKTGLEAEVAAVRAETDVPVAVGFGVSTPEQAA
ncbi:MAG TPA: tryptophan synthase subunit alpha, partial [Longimicrobium sp.]|nr:tryptophan synthase subunit alpha [Longimicrobium sp.]